MAQVDLADERVWTSQQGSTVQGKLLEVQGGKVVILINGERRELLLNQLSQTDQDYVAATNQKPKGSTKTQQGATSPKPLTPDLFTSLPMGRNPAYLARRVCHHDELIILDGYHGASVIHDYLYAGSDVNGKSVKKSGDPHGVVYASSTIQTTSAPSGVDGITNRGMLFHLGPHCRINNHSDRPSDDDPSDDLSMRLYEGEIWFEVNRKILRERNEVFALQIPGGRIDVTEGKHYIKVHQGSIVAKSYTGSLECVGEASFRLAQGDSIRVANGEFQRTRIPEIELNTTPLDQLDFQELAVHNDKVSEGLSLYGCGVTYHYYTDEPFLLHSYRHPGWAVSQIGQFQTQLSLSTAGVDKMVVDSMEKTVKDHARKYGVDVERAFQKTTFEGYIVNFMPDCGNLKRFEPIGYWLKVRIDCEELKDPLVISRSSANRNEILTCEPGKSFEFFYPTTSTHPVDSLGFTIQHEKLLELGGMEIQLEARAMVKKDRRWVPYLYSPETTEE